MFRPKCPSCGASMRRATQDVSRSIDSLVFEASLPAAECPECGETTFEFQDLARFDLEVAQSLLEHGARSPATLKFVRKALGLKGVEAADLLSISHETLSRWENGKIRPDLNAVAVLGGLVSDALAGQSTMRDRLRALATPKLPANPIRLRIERQSA
ncbi:MAG: type II toxin-antitoxin system MqsA family antitoxin [Myxococcales bacterium]|nr:type II toxin-antitoxin system MqsA family antitoxin [Myxococcales bacterium]